MSAITEQNDRPFILRSGGVADRRTPLFVSGSSSKTGRKALSSPSSPEQTYCSNGDPEGSQTDVLDLESPAADLRRKHQRRRPASRDTIIDCLILDQVDNSQRETEMQTECVDDIADNDGDLTGQDDTEANDDQDYEGAMESESESESEQSTAENWSPQQRQRPNTFSHLLPPLSSISDESSFSSVRLTRSKTNVQAHPSNQFHLT
jgi:hypothetical protein